jgi:hypothetical protein
VPESLESLLGRAPNSFNELDADELLHETRQAIATLFRNSAARKFHLIALVQNKRCSDLDDFAKSVIAGSVGMKAGRPVIINMAYGRNGTHGAAIICNQAAYDCYTRYLETADRGMHISKRELPLSAGRFKNYQKVDDPDDPDDPDRKVLCVTRRLTPENYQVIDMGDGVYKFGLPSTLIYRTRTQLSLAYKVMELSGLDDYFIVTMGDRLLKEGIVVKTWQHELAPNAMICGYTHSYFLKRAVDEMLQAIGRLCGIRHDGCVPTLHLIQRNANQFRDMINIDERIISSVLLSRSRKRTVGDLLRVGLTSMTQNRDGESCSQKLSRHRFNGREYRVADFADNDGESATLHPSIVALRKYLIGLPHMAMRRGITGVLLSAIDNIYNAEDETWTDCYAVSDAVAAEATGFETGEICTAPQVYNRLLELAKNPTYEWIQFCPMDQYFNPSAENTEIIVVTERPDFEEESIDSIQLSILVRQDVARAFLWCTCSGPIPLPNNAGAICSECSWMVHSECHIGETEEEGFDADEYICPACKVEIGMAGLSGAPVFNTLFANFFGR